LLADMGGKTWCVGSGFRRSVTQLRRCAIRNWTFPPFGGRCRQMSSKHQGRALDQGALARRKQPDNRDAQAGPLAAKARGLTLGTPKLHTARKSAVDAVRARADRYAANVLPIIHAQKGGRTHPQRNRRSTQAPEVSPRHAGAVVRAVGRECSWCGHRRCSSKVIRPVTLRGASV
jgi:hypothetical protein